MPDENSTLNKQLKWKWGFFGIWKGFPRDWYLEKNGDWFEVPWKQGYKYILVSPDKHELLANKSRA